MADNVIIVCTHQWIPVAWWYAYNDSGQVTNKYVATLACVICMKWKHFMENPEKKCT